MHTKRAKRLVSALMCANVVNGTDADTAIAECLSQIEAIGY